MSCAKFFVLRAVYGTNVAMTSEYVNIPISFQMLQMFGSGTACAVSPVGRIVYKHEDRIEELVIPTMSSDVDVMQRFYDTIVGIQQGREDRPEWVHIVC